MKLFWIKTVKIIKLHYFSGCEFKNFSVLFQRKWSELESTSSSLSQLDKVYYIIRNVSIWCKDNGSHSRCLLSCPVYISYDMYNLKTTVGRLYCGLTVVVWLCMIAAQYRLSLRVVFIVFHSLPACLVSHGPFCPVLGKTGLKLSAINTSCQLYFYIDHLE